MHTKFRYLAVLFVIVAALLALTARLALAKDGRIDVLFPQSPMGTGFTYQGQLTDGDSPANGEFDFQFSLYDAETDGTLLGTVTLEDVTVAEGLFTVELDFGAGVFNGEARWLAISVRLGAESDDFTALAPRQALTAAPYAQYAMEAGTVAWEDVSDNPIPSGCAAGQIMAWNTTLSMWECVENSDTTYNAGFGLGLDGDTFSVLTGTVQARVTGACSPGSMVTAVNADGTVVCETDDDTTYAAGFGLGLDSNTFNVLTGTVQARVMGTCSPGSMVSAINADGSVECKPHDTRPIFTQVTLESDGDIGHNSSIIIGTDGLPIISYADFSNKTLKAAHCDDIACTSITTSTLDTSEADGVRHTSITIGADGLPIISYYGKTSLDLKVAHCNDIACTSAAITNLDTTGDVGDYSSITIGADGLAIISYYDATNTDLKVAHCNNITCTNATVTGVDTTDDVGNYSSITIGADGLAIISYYDATNTDLKVAHCNNLTCTGVTANTLYSGNGGWVTSITIGNDGLPIIAFRTNDTGSTITVAHCNEIICATSTNTNLYAHSSYVDGDITIGSDGLPIIAIRDNATGDLRTAHCNNTACTSASITIQDSVAHVGDPSITVGVDGMPIISYTDNNLDDLKVTHCSNVFCVPYFRRR